MKVITVLASSKFDGNGGHAVVVTERGKSEIFDCMKVDETQNPLNLKPYKLTYKYLNPLQTAFVRFFDGDSWLCCAATSAGKSGLMHIFFQSFEGRKLYLAPTKALCEEKFKEFVQIYGKENVEIRTGDRFEFEPPKAEFVISTFESALVSARLRSAWIREVSAVCIDEMHFIFFGDRRGIFLEELITHLHSMGKKIIALSATVPKKNAESVAKWLKTNLLLCEWRPVPLHRQFHGTVGNLERKLFGYPIAKRIEEKLVPIIENLAQGEKILIFVPSKRFGWKLLEAFDRNSYRVMNEVVPFEKVTVDGEPAVAFHNADIPLDERTEIEREFREGKMRFLIATQTLAYGVNLPADEAFILVRLIRTENGLKLVPDISTILQMEGRVGRFGLTEIGISNLIAISGAQALLDELRQWERNDSEVPTELERMLQRDSKKRVTKDFASLIILGIIIAHDIDVSRPDAHSRIKKFLRSMKSNVSEIENMLHKILDDLKRSGCISENGKVTPLGLMLASTLIPPSAYTDFYMRAKFVENILAEIHFVIRPLLFMRDLNWSFIDLLPELLKAEVEANFKEDDDGESVLKFWMGGHAWLYFKSPPAQFYFRPDVLQLARTLGGLKNMGVVKLTWREIEMVCSSLDKGVPPHWSPFANAREIGFSRANAIYHTAQKLNLSPSRALEKLRAKDREFSDAMFDVMRERIFKIRQLDTEWAERDPAKQKERVDAIQSINREIEKILSAFEDIKSIDDLFDEEIARILAFTKYGNDAVRWSRQKLKDFLLSG